jgi:hypothetical protein
MPGQEAAVAAWLVERLPDGAPTEWQVGSDRTLCMIAFATVLRC